MTIAKPPKGHLAMFIVGKEPPRIEEQGDSIQVHLIGGTLSVLFNAFIAEENQHGIDFRFDYLLILQYLLAHPEIDTATAARICQRR